MNGYDLENTLKTMQIIVDTREHPTEQAKKRWDSFGCPTVRAKLNVGDYSATFTLPNGEEWSMADKVVFERKMSIDELAMCFGTDRKRFTAEFERAKTAGTRMYLLVEGATWERILGHKYKSQLNPAALIGSIVAFTARYDCNIVFCEGLTTARIITEFLRKEAKEKLKEIEEK